MGVIGVPRHTSPEEKLFWWSVLLHFGMPHDLTHVNRWWLVLRGKRNHARHFRPKMGKRTPTEYRNGGKTSKLYAGSCVRPTLFGTSSSVLRNFPKKVLLSNDRRFCFQTTLETWPLSCGRRFQVIDLFRFRHCFLVRSLFFRTREGVRPCFAYFVGDVFVLLGGMGSFSMFNRPSSFCFPSSIFFSYLFFLTALVHGVIVLFLK